MIPEPGSKYGPCAEPCDHRDCRENRRMAAAACHFCGQPIGYNRRYVQAHNWTILAHDECPPEGAWPPNEPAPAETPAPEVSAC